MKKKIILAIAMSAIVSSTATAIALGSGTKTAKILAAYYEYYQASELFFDELDEDTHGLVFETGSDAGCDYWAAKYKLESLTGLKHKRL